MKKYIAHKRFKGKCLCGDVNIPARSELIGYAGVLCYGGKPICFEASEVAHQHFARNDDGEGMRRGNLTRMIQKTLSKSDAKYQERWDKVWNDAACRPYKREEDEDYWLWNHSFFCADIAVLRHIAELVGVKGEF